jgi:stage III sporulation protein AH
MKVFKRKQIVILSLIMLILVAGYLQYSYKKSNITTDTQNVGKSTGDSVFVDNSKTTDNTQSTVKTQQTKDTNTKDNKDKSSDSSGKDTASKKANDYFAQTKLDLETERSKDMETLNAITKDTNADAQSKKSAYEKVMKLTELSEKEAKMAALIKQKEFSDVIVIANEDGYVDVTVKSPTLTSSQVAKIADIVSRQMNITLNKIRVKNIY